MKYQPSDKNTNVKSELKKDVNITNLVEQLTDVMESGELHETKILPEAKLPTTVREHIQLFARCMIIYDVIMKIGTEEMKRKKNSLVDS